MITEDVLEKEIETPRNLVEVALNAASFFTNLDSRRIIQ
jgi:hypothetical protein